MGSGVYEGGGVSFIIEGRVSLMEIGLLVFMWEIGFIMDSIFYNGSEGDWLYGLKLDFIQEGWMGFM